MDGDLEQPRRVTLDRLGLLSATLVRRGVCAGALKIEPVGDGRMAIRLEAWEPSQDVVLRVKRAASRAVCSMRGETTCKTMPGRTAYNEACHVLHAA